MVVKEHIKNKVSALIEESQISSREKDFSRGVYVSVDLDPTQVRRIWDYMKKVGIQVMPIQKAHVTVMFSTTNPKNIPEIKNNFNGTVRPKAIRIFGKGTRAQPYALVVEFDSPDLKRLHDYYKREYNLRPSYSEYKPHMTLSYDIERVMPGLRNLRPKQKETIENIFSKMIPELPKSIRIHSQHLEGLDENWK